MKIEVLQILWLFATFTLTAQGLVDLRMKPIITAECDKQVTLHCNSSYHHELSVKYMEWSQDSATFCSVDSKGNIRHNHSSSTSNFHCEYKNGSLSLTFDKVLPLDVEQWKPFRCKQRSNRGAPQKYTKVQLQECSGHSEGVLRRGGPACTFTQVYPDGDVHWFSDSHNLSDGSVQPRTVKRVDEQGWMTVHSYLEVEHMEGTYNCSLISTVSGRVIASALVHEDPKESKLRRPTRLNSVGCQSHGSMWMVLMMFLQILVPT